MRNKPDNEAITGASIHREFRESFCGQSKDSSAPSGLKVLLPLLVTLGVYELVQHKVKIAWILVILMAVGIVGSFFGVFAI